MSVHRGFSNTESTAKQRKRSVFVLRLLRVELKTRKKYHAVTGFITNLELLPKTISVMSQGEL
jgi:hypothetical protein